MPNRTEPGYCRSLATAPWGELRVRNGMVVADWAGPEGWCGLGDLARLDDDGYPYLGPRLDGMINTGSYHVYPQEVQDAITALPWCGRHWCEARMTLSGDRLRVPKSHPQVR